MPEVPLLLPADQHLKKPEWLNDPLNYHDRGNIDFGSCSQHVLRARRLLRPRRPVHREAERLNGLAQIYASWITRFHVDGFRVDTAKHVNAAFFKLWVPKIRAAARSVGIADFPIFGEVSLNDAIDLSAFVRDRGLPQVLDFPFQQVATGYAAGAPAPRASATGSHDDDYFRLPNGIDPALRRRSSATTTWAARRSRSCAGTGAGRRRARCSTSCSATTSSTSSAARRRSLRRRGRDDRVAAATRPRAQDMFPTQVRDWQTRETGGLAADRQRLVLRRHRQSDRGAARALSAVRDAYPALATGASVVRRATDAVLVVSRIDLAAHELVAAFNNGAAAAHVTVPVATPNTNWQLAFGSGTARRRARTCR